MKLTQTIHDVKSINIKELKKETLKPTGEKFCIRHIVIDTENNGQIELSLFADEAESLEVKVK